MAQLSRAIVINLARRACNPLGQGHMSITGTPDLSADGKDYRANFVHAPFPEKSVRQAPS